MRTKDKSQARPKESPGRRPGPAPDAARRTHPTALAALAASGALGPREVLQMQRAFGNRAVATLLNGGPRRGAPAGAAPGVLQRVADEDGRPRPDVARATAAEGAGGAALPAGLREGAERLSGVPLGDVRVRYNSRAPARLDALAYTRGTEIHLAPGQERHLAHEAWHVVQQKQGRVRPTLQAGGLAVNDDRGLEREADLMGGRAASTSAASTPITAARAASTPSLAGRGPSRGASVQLKGGAVIQLFSQPPANPPQAGVRGSHLNADGVPDESHITTRDGQANDLVGAVPGVAIRGWNYIQGVGATGTWVRFHLVNEQIGGLGNQNNLVPTSQATNHDPDWRKFERTCQHHEGQQTGMHVTVEVYYPAADANAAQGTVEANQHYYPNRIRGRCYLWDANANAYQLNANGAPANQNTFSVDFNPFPLLPPADADVTVISDMSTGWVYNTLMERSITRGGAQSLYEAIQGTYGGDDIAHFLNEADQATPELELLDALDSFLAVELNSNQRVPVNARVHILNGSYTL